MLSRRAIIKASLGVCGCSICGALGRTGGATTARAAEPGSVAGQGYVLRFIGSQRDTIMHGKVAAAVDLRTLAATRHLYAIGPIEQLRGEITIIDSRPALARVAADGAVKVAESFEAGAPFLVWAEVPAWRTIPIPAEVRTSRDLEAFVPRAAAAAGLAPERPLPFLIQGSNDRIDFHILNRIGDEPHDAEKHKQIQVPFALKRVEAIVVGFYSQSHRGIFTTMDSAIHIHFQTPDNGASGHIQDLEIAAGAMLSLPRET